MMRALPLHDPHRVRVSALMLEHARKHITPEEYRRARSRIEAAAKRHGVVLPPSREPQHSA